MRIDETDSRYRDNNFWRPIEGLVHISEVDWKETKLKKGMIKEGKVIKLAPTYLQPRAYHRRNQTAL